MVIDKKCFRSVYSYCFKVVIVVIVVMVVIEIVIIERQEYYIEEVYYYIYCEFYGIVNQLK